MVSVRPASRPLVTLKPSLVLALWVALSLPRLAAGQPGEAPGPPVRGEPDAVLEIVEFSDFQCPYCAAALPVLDSLFARHPGDIRLIFRHYPLPAHDRAENAARASVEAARQDAFWPYHDLLFAHQDRLSDADLIGYADSLGLDGESFAAALAAEGHAEQVDQDVEWGRSLGVTGTPTFFVNGYRVVGTPPLWVLEEALKAFQAGRVEPRPVVTPAGAGGPPTGTTG